MSVAFAVLDSSVGVKWLRDEEGSADAQGLLRSHQQGGLRIVVASLFMYEVIGTAARRFGPGGARHAWAALDAYTLAVIQLDSALADAAARQMERLGCKFFDAIPAALADRLGTTLVSADHKAHGAFPGVRLIG